MFAELPPAGSARPSQTDLKGPIKKQIDNSHTRERRPKQESGKQHKITEFQDTIVRGVPLESCEKKFLNY
jgi:hypothetical protein